MIDLLQIEGKPTVIVQLPSDVAAAADSCVPAWLVAMIVIALGARELVKWNRTRTR